MEKRTGYIDIAKGIAILAVVLSHIQFQSIGGTLFPVRTIFAGGMWHVPVFFILAGFFIKEEKIRVTAQFIKGKIKSIHLFTLYFYIPAVLLHNVFFEIGFYSTTADYNGKKIATYNAIDFVKNVLASIFFAGREPIVGPLWFAYVLCLAFIGYALLTLFCKKMFLKVDYEKVRFLICLSLAIVSAIFSNELNMTINRFSNTIVVMLLLSIGQFFYQKKKVSFDSWFAFGIAVLLSWQNAVLNGNVNLNANQYHDLYHLVCGSCAALYVICFISKKIEYTKVGAFLKYAGEKSFYIMALHLVSFKIFALLLSCFGGESAIDVLTPTVGQNIFLILGYAFFGILIPMAFAKVVGYMKNNKA